MRYEMLTNYCSTELKTWTREPKRWENLGKGMIAVLAKLPMRDVCLLTVFLFSNTKKVFIKLHRTVNLNLSAYLLVHPVICDKSKTNFNCEIKFMLKYMHMYKTTYRLFRIFSSFL